MCFPGDNASFWVQTAAYLHRHYYKIPADRFDYIVVDEAHHAPAQGLSKILEHFTPSQLLGVTATPERFDQQRLLIYIRQWEICHGGHWSLVPRTWLIKPIVSISDSLLHCRQFLISQKLKVSRPFPGR